MEMRQCTGGGHYYDASIYQQCPYCTGGNANAPSPFGAYGESPMGATVPFGEMDGPPVGATMPFGAYGESPVGATMPFGEMDSPGATMAIQDTGGFDGGPSFGDDAFGDGDPGRTMAVIKKDLGFDPVVGWLVSVEGPDRGNDYRLRADKNSVGRGEGMDVCLRKDDTISRDNHVTVSFDAKDRKFYLTPGEGRGLVRVDDKAVFDTVELRPYNIIELGKTKLVLVALRGDMFEWLVQQGG